MIYQFYLWDSESFKKAVFFFLKIFLVIVKSKRAGRFYQTWKHSLDEFQRNMWVVKGWYTPNKIIRQGEKCPEAVLRILKISLVLTLWNSEGKKINSERPISCLVLWTAHSHLNTWSSELCSFHQDELTSSNIRADSKESRVHPKWTHNWVLLLRTSVWPATVGLRAAGC